MIQEKIFEDNGLMRIVRTQDVEPHIRSAAEMRENLKPRSDLRHVGTIPSVIAEQWSRECGAAPGTAEFLAYVQKKLMSGEFSKFATGRF